MKPRLKSNRKTPRQTKKKPLVRGESVVQTILAVTLDQLAEVGFATLRIEDIAERARVNKTTVYRRWPTKAALVRAALLTIAGDEIRLPETGALRSDLLAIGAQFGELATRPHWQSVIRMIVAEGPDSELGAIAESLRKSYEPLRRRLVSTAMARKEVATVEDGLLLLEVFDAALHFRLFVSKVGVDRKFLERLADLLLPRRSVPAAKRERRLRG